MGKLGRLTLAVCVVLGGFFTLTAVARAQSDFEGSWNGTWVLTFDGNEVTGTFDHLTIGEGGQLDGLAIGENSQYEIAGVVSSDGSEVLWNALPNNPDDLGATLSGTATLDDEAHLSMSLDSIPFDRLHLEVHLEREKRK